MNLFKPLFFIAALVATCGIAYYAIQKNTLAPASANSNVLLVGTSDDYPPFTFNKDGTIVGFDIDLIHDIGHRMAQKVVIKNMSFDLLLLELQRGSIEVIAAGLTPTVERAEKVFFAEPHLQGDPLLVITLKGQAPLVSLPEMEGLTVGVNEGYTADFYLSKTQTITLTRLENVAQAMLALKQKRIDAFVTAANAIEPFFELYGKDDYVITTLPGVTESYALAISKKYPELLQRINATLTEMKEDGTIADFKHKWGIK